VAVRPPGARAMLRRVGTRAGAGAEAPAGGPPFGALLRRHREEAGLTQEALAERARLSVRAVSALERGVNRAPRPGTLRLLAGALGLAPAARAALVAAARPAPRPPGGGAPPGPGRHTLPAPLTSSRGAHISRGACAMPAGRSTTATTARRQHAAGAAGSPGGRW